MDLRLTAVIAGLALMSAWTSIAYPDEAQDQARQRAVELSEVRGQIEAVKRRVERDTRLRGSAESELRDKELAIAAASRRLDDVRRDKHSSQERREQLRDRQRSLEADLSAEQHSLSEQLRLAYMNGRQERLKLVLNQQDPARLGRLMVYYAYLGDMRAEKIAGVNNMLTELIEVVQAVDTETKRLDTLEQQQSDQLDRLKLARRDRGKVVASLNKIIATHDARLEKLTADAKALERLIEDIQRVLANIPVDTQEPFSQWRGKLAWPLQGRLVTDFGQNASNGGLKSNGVLIAASMGSEVYAIYHGRVAFADWLPGMGLLIVIEHGDGFMSLYGHNEALFRSVGEWVQPGDVIAAVGDSGGQNQSALYFEIRQGTRPVNPHRWVGSRLSRR